MKKAIILGSIGLWRKFLKDSLEYDGIDVVCFVDSYEAGSVYDGCPIISLEELPKYAEDFSGLILVTFPINNKRREIFLNNTLSYFKKSIEIMKMEDVYKKYKNALVKAKDVGCFWLNKDYDKKRSYKILEYLSDEKSKYIIDSWINFRETLDVNYLVQPEDSCYFPEDLNLYQFVPNYYFFLDLGAYNGNTYLFLKNKLSEFGKKLSLYAALEPDKINFSSLVKIIEKHKNENEKIILLNFACFSENKLLNFFQTGKDFSSIKPLMIQNESFEKTIIFANSLDNTFKGLKFDIIKLDIEGSEYDCLMGMKNLIVESQPIIMSCIYHKPEDFYEILEFLADLLKNCQFYVRTHASFFMDTVLYVIPRSRILGNYNNDKDHTLKCPESKKN